MNATSVLPPWRGPSRRGSRVLLFLAVLLSVFTAVPATGHAPGSSTYGVVGCSNTEGAVRGYTAASTLDLLLAGDLGGGSIREWGDPLDADYTFYWDQYTQLRPTGGYQAVLWQPCIRATDHAGVMTAEHQAWADVIVARIRELDPGVTIHAVPLNFFEQECPASGLEGPAVTAEIVDWARSEHGLARGPDLGPLAPNQLLRDLCHPNSAGRAILGAQLVDYLDAGLVSGGAVPDIDAPLSADLGTAATGTSIDGVVTITNPSGVDLNITGLWTTEPAFAPVSLPPLVVAAGTSADVTVRFTPPTEGLTSGRLVVESDDPAEPVVTTALSGTGTAGSPVADIDVSPLQLDFGAVPVGGSATMATTVTNVGSSDLTLTAATTTGEGFSEVTPALPLTLGPGAGTGVSVQFDPASIGVFAGELSITSDDPDEPVVTVALSGTGDSSSPEPELSVTPQSLDFGDVIVGASATSDVVVDNLGTSDLSITGITVTGPAFSTSATAPASVAAGSSLTLPVIFAPGAEGLVAGELVISSDDADEPTVTIPLSGTGTSTPPPPPSATAIAVNAAGGDYTSNEGDVFAADQAFASGSWGYEGGSTGSVTAPIAGTEDDALYQAYRTGSAFSYRFDGLAAGDYTVDLHFVEPRTRRTGSRIMDVSAEGVVVIDDLDLVAVTGARQTAHVETFTATVADGRLDLDFTASSQTAVVSAVIVTPVASQPPPEPPPDPPPPPDESPFATPLTTDTVGSTGYSNWTAGETGALPAYREQSTKDLLVGGYTYGSLDWALWRSLDPTPWDRLYELEPAGGYRAMIALFGILEEDANDGVIDAEHEAGVVAVLDEFLARDLSGTLEVVWWTPMMQYDNAESPVSGPALSIALRDYALSLNDNYPFEILPGPLMGPLTGDLLDPDNRHLNEAGAGFVGSQLVDFFDSFGE